MYSTSTCTLYNIGWNNLHLKNYTGSKIRESVPKCYPLVLDILESVTTLSQKCYPLVLDILESVTTLSQKCYPLVLDILESVTTLSQKCYPLVFILMVAVTTLTQKCYLLTLDIDSVTIQWHSPNRGVWHFHHYLKGSLNKLGYSRNFPKLFKEFSQVIQGIFRGY